MAMQSARPRATDEEKERVAWSVASQFTSQTQEARATGFKIQSWLGRWLQHPLTERLMSLKILNEGDIDRELQKLAASAYSPVVKQWLQTAVKSHLSNLEGADRDENFRVYDAANVKPLHGEPPPFDKLPDWAKAALEHDEILYWFDPIQIYKRTAWKTIKTIAVWMNAFPHDLALKMQPGRQKYGPPR